MMWLPTKLYESLPLLYLGVGTMLLLGALYIGAGQGPMPAYVVLGSSCMMAGLFVSHIRRKARSQAALNPE